MQILISKTLNSQNNLEKEKPEDSHFLISKHTTKYNNPKSFIGIETDIEINGTKQRTQK